MRVAIFSDVHGNDIALDAVLDDIERNGGVDEYWVVGDLVALGPKPLGVLERLDDIDALCTRGNTDRYVFAGDRPPPTLEAARADPELVAQYAEVHAGFTWTQGYLQGVDRLDDLAKLPLEHRTTLADGTRVLAVHAAPGTDEGPGIRADSPDAALAELLLDVDADVVFVGHTHRHLDRSVDGVRVINLGSVSLPHPSDLRASWTLLQSTEQGHTVSHHRVAYDLDAVLASIRAARYPSREWLSTFFRGEGVFA